MKNRAGKSLTAADRLTLKNALAFRASKGNFTAIRLRALVLLTWGSGLRLSESTALKISQVIEGIGPQRYRIVSRGILSRDQAKRKRARRFYIPREARSAIRDYLEAARKKKLIAIPDKASNALFVSTQSQHKGRALNVRTIELQWQALQKKTGIVNPYRWHDLRHEAASMFARKATNPYQVRDFLGVKNLSTADIYVHSTDDEILEIAEEATL